MVYPRVRGKHQTKKLSFDFEKPPGNATEARQLIELGLHIGINGCSLKTSENLACVREHIPLDRLMLETDAPWCGIKATHPSSQFVVSQFPSCKREKFQAGNMVKDRNEPALIVQVAEVIAGLKNVSVQAVADAAWFNSCTIFGGLRE
eukprot:TRINITY_DN2907_c0_g1_i1.p1 TRINITY_DN2907_c0_g1~~TRINITY_DN2907_c0_g1_i1.p1  ORF type:complete len:148 (-),score=18.66 TRINITY_DN2907_c0_g1_i1:22-465(-)